MKALTILEPFASLIAGGFKHYETRGFPTRIRGRIAIHAGKSKTHMMGRTARDPAMQILAAAYRRQNIYGSPDLNLDLLIKPGFVIATAEIAACYRVDGVTWDKNGRKIVAAHLEDGTVIEGKELDFGFYRIGAFAWRLKKAEPINPIAAKGQQGFWEWEGKEG